MTRRLFVGTVFGSLAFAAVLGGCGDDSPHVGHDAAIDSPPPLVDAPPPPAGHSFYVIDKLSLPTTTTQARQFALDLNGDVTVDNQLGMMISTLAGMGYEPQAWADKQIDTGSSIMLADFYTVDSTTAAASTFTLYQGANPMPAACANAQDTMCRHHLAGTATFTALAAPVDPPLTGDFVNGTLAAGPGHLTIQLAFPGAPAVTLTLLGARVKLSTVSATVIGNAILAGGVTSSDVDGKIIPAMQTGLMTAVTRDCPTATTQNNCLCTDNSTGKTNLGLFDTDHNCAISVDEVRNSSLLTSLLSPDVTLENQNCLSIGVSAHAVSAGFVAPQ